MRNKIISIFLVIVSLFSMLIFASYELKRTESVDYAKFYTQISDACKNDDLEVLEIDKNEDDESFLRKLENYKNAILSEENAEIDNVSDRNVQAYSDYYSENLDKKTFLESNDFVVKETNEALEIYPKFGLKRLIVQGKLKENFGANVISGYKDYNVLCFDTIEETKLAYQKLKQDNSVLVSVDKITSLEGYADNDYDYSSYKSWGSKAVDVAGFLEYLNDNNKTQKEIVVAVIDTGINTIHEMFDGRFLTDENGDIVGKSFYSSTYSYSNYEFEDDNGHGTHVAGIIADMTPKNVKIMPVRSLSTNGKGTMTNVLSGISFVDSMTEKYNISCINMSLGVDDSDEESRQIYENLFLGLREKGILTAVAAGNNSSDVKDFLPASTSSSIVVSALKVSQDFAYEFDSSYSNYGSSVDICAPGSKINSADIGGKTRYKERYGTSMATPFVSGVISLLYLDNFSDSSFIGKNSDLSNKIESTIKENAIDLGESGYDEYYGYGMVNLKYFEVKKSSETLNFQNQQTGENLDIVDGYIEFNNDFNLSVNCTSSDYTIFYTTDGTIPTKNSKLYSSPIAISDTSSFAFVAYKFDELGNIVEFSDVYFMGLFSTKLSIWNYITYYPNSNGEIFIMSYTGHYRNLVLPGSFQGMVEIVGINSKVFENNKELETVTLSNSIKTIESSAFSRCYNLKEIDASGVTEIKDNVFYNCKNLSKVNAPLVTKVGDYAFYETAIKYLYSSKSELEEYLGSGSGAKQEYVGAYFENLAEIGAYSFAKIEVLEFVSLENLKNAQSCAFADNINLVYCNVPNLEILGSYAFDNCKMLDSFVIGEFVDAIGSSVFRGTDIKEFELNENNKNFYTDGNGLYSKNRLISFVQDKTIGINYEILEEIIISDQTYKVTSIDEYTFDGSVLKKLILPEGLETIGKGCFYGSTIDIVDYNIKSLDSSKYIFSGKAYPIFENAYIKILNLNSSVEKTPSSLFKLSNIALMNINKYDIEYNSGTFVLSNISKLYLNFDNTIDSTYFSKKIGTSILSGLEIFYLKNEMNINISYTDSSLGVKKTFYSSNEPQNGYYFCSIDQNASSEIFYTVSDYSGNYDGNYHNIDVNVIGVSGYTITYGLSEGECNINNITTNLSFKNSTSGLMTVYFKISASGWADTYGFGYITINKIALDLQISNASGFYGEEPDLSKVGYEITSGKLVNGESLDFTYYVDADKKSNVGYYTIQAMPNTDIINYDINFSFGMYEITKRNLTIKLRDITRTYGEVDLNNNEYDIVSGSVANNDDLKIVLDFGTSDYFVGTYSVTLKSYDTRNYNIEYTSSILEIEKRIVKIKIADNLRSVYGEEVQLKENSYKITQGSFAFNDADIINFKVVVNIDSISDEGIYNVTGTYNENLNYTLEVTDGKYIVSKRNVKISIEDSSSVFGEDVILNGYKVVSGNFIGEDESICGIHTSTKAKYLSDVGSYDIEYEYTKMKNYILSFTYIGKHTITKRDVVIKINDVESHFGDNIYLNGYEIDSGNFVGDDLENLNFVVCTGVSAISEVGDYEIYATYNDLTNYNLIVQRGIYKITKRNVKIKIANFYGIYGNDIKLSNNYTIVKGDFIGDDGNLLNLKFSTNASKYSKVGTYEVLGSCDELKNYNVEFENGSYVISKRQLEIKISDQSGIYGDTPRYNLEYSILYGTKISGDDLQIVIYSEATNESPVGEYVLSGTTNNPNYEVIVNFGVYRIMKRQVTIKADNQKLPHFGKIELDQTKYSAVVGSIVNNDDMGVVLTVENVDRKSKWGEYEITITAQNDNYEISTQNGTLTIEISIYDGTIVGGAVFVLIIIISIISSIKRKKRRQKLLLAKKEKKLAKQNSTQTLQMGEKRRVSSQSKPLSNKISDGKNGSGSKFV